MSENSGLVSKDKKYKDCIFCNLPSSRILDESEYFLVIRDMYPVTKMHSLIISKRHVENIFDLIEKELIDMNSFILKTKINLENLDTSISGFNIGTNVGKSAGQTIFHFHMHIIPRRDGDAENSRGGVRGVISEKQDY